ncbi:MAG: ATP-binding protein, partial [Actinomycetota bacterium]|nr:ATP-binding protein [Actinomycetota bacterium]
MVALSPPTTKPLTRIEEQSAAIRIERLFSIFVGAGYFAYLAILGPQIAAQFSITAAWWNLLAPLAIFIPPALLLTAAVMRRRAIARWASRTCAIAFPVVALCWLPAWNGGTVSDQLWFSIIPGLAGLAAAITLPPRWALTLMTAAIIPAQVANA